MKCDNLGKRSAENFLPESPLVIVCEGFHESGLVCALLRHLDIQHCDVTFPKKKMGAGGISDVVALLSGVDTITGIAIVRDADEDPAASFAESAAAFISPYQAPKSSFVVHRVKHRKSGVFLMPGKDKNGATEHLFFEAFTASHAGLAQYVKDFEVAAINMAGWADNAKAKMRMQCAVASFCEDDPQCSLGFIWQKGADNPLDIASPVFDELAAFLKDFSQ